MTGGVPRAPGSLRTWTRVEAALAGVLLVSAGLAWWLTASVSMPNMRTGLLTGAGTADGGMAVTAPGGHAAFWLFLVTWIVMMAAMMLPAVVPFTVTMSRLLRGAAPGHGGPAALTAGYLVVWGLLGLVAYLVLRGFDTVAAGGTTTAVRAGAVVLLVAGVFQFTPLKRWCLVHCRSPVAQVLRHGARAGESRWGALAVGVRHGGYCVGCCWALMAVLLAVGVMNLAWMAAVAAVITVEKTLPHGALLSRVLGGVLLLAGGVLLALPGVLVPG